MIAICKKELVEFYWVSHLEWDSSATLSHYRQTRRLLAAPFRAWPIRTLIIQPGQGGLPLLTPIDAILSADVASTLLRPSDLVSLSNSPSTQAPLGSQTCATGPPGNTLSIGLLVYDNMVNSLIKLDKIAPNLEYFSIKCWEYNLHVSWRCYEFCRTIKDWNIRISFQKGSPNDLARLRTVSTVLVQFVDPALNSSTWRVNMKCIRWWMHCAAIIKWFIIWCSQSYLSNCFLTKWHF